ncbi:RodZ domain-containing protein [Salinicola rhizosphaerae]|uniref:Cro/Cl family transcriptional regulator n=1 Tax=Salinicola rhizosphaerae TaxID=1443141 RepID=A0ABQ3E8C9_9GAMM|nr:RodZ domain-containing protein [Salinicola rhizosphaerae]GHB22627.1 Cro/Cl family transcriptional regulator [Salinicola rhizosphaerae]
MSETNESTPKINETPRDAHETAGIMLRRERERQGLSLDEIALQLNLRPIVVTGLEEDQFDQVPIAAYRRGYVRAYARLLGMDETLVVGAYDAKHGRADIDRKLSPVNTARPPSRVGAWVFRLFTLLVIVGLIALTLLWWQSREGNDVFGGGDSPAATDSLGSGDSTMTPNSDTALPPTSTPQNTPAATDASDLDAPGTGNLDSGGVAASAETSTPDAGERQAEQIDDSAVSGTATTADSTAANSDGTAESGSDGESSDTTANASTSSETTDQAATASANTLSLTFNEESWTEIYDANDDRIFSGLQSAGSQATAEGTPPFRLTIGNASGVSLEYRGEPVDLGQYTGGNNVARFTLGD